MKKLHASFLLAVLCVSASLFAGSTGSTALHSSQGSAAGLANGDFVSDATAPALNTFYRYFVEVPAGITRLQIEMFDADLGQGGAAEADAGRDRSRGSFVTTATYSLFDPSGTTRTTRFTTGSTALPAAADNAWLTFYNATGNTVLDQFGTNAYTNNNGNNNWTTNWVENDGGGGGATGGAILVTGGQLQVGDNVAGTPDIYREADLSGTPGLNMGVAYLTFDYNTSGNLEGADQVSVQVSNNGGASYTTLNTFSDDVTGTFSADITPYIANNTRIRFLVVGGLSGGEFFLFDNVQIADGPITAGHWEIRIDASGDDDINAIGIRAHDGTAGSGGTELNVYVDSLYSIGVNPDPGENSRSYTLYPWITSGCQCSQNDFDRDSNQVDDIGSVSYTSRTGSFTQTFANDALSIDSNWNRDDLTRWGDDDESDDYGIWTLQSTINTYTVGAENGNYETAYVGSYSVGVNPPTANPIVAGGNPAAFRIYLPTDAGAAPVKPYLEQFLTYNRNFLGPNPPQVGLQTTYTVTVRLTNPTPYAVTFSATNLVTANVPGGQTLYGGSVTVSQGSLVSQPAVGGSGNITWNPGTVAAGATALFAYNVRITPTSSARVLATATPASGNGTRAQYVDETGNNTQARATYLMGGICELAVQAGLLTEALLTEFTLDVRGGGTNIEFATASEAGTVGFNVYRADGGKVNDTLIPASLKPHGGKYRLFDRMNSDPNATYVVEEVTAGGKNRRYGPMNRLANMNREEMQRNRPRRVKASSVAAGEYETAAKEKVVAAMAGVSATGLVRIPASDLATALDASENQVLKSLANNGHLSVTRDGTQVAWTTDGQNLIFYGEKSTSIYSNERVYRIELTNSGTEMKRVQLAPASGPVTAFTATQEIETDVFAATVLPLNPESDYWFWDFVISGDPTYGRKTFAVNVPAVASSSGAVLSVRLQGAMKDGQHEARVTVNGVPVGSATWASFDAQTATINLPAGVLVDGANEIEVEGVLAPAASMDIFYVDGFSVRYQKFARPDAGQIAVRASGAVVAGPFATQPMIVDVSNAAKPALVQGASFTGGTAGVMAPSTASLLFTETFIAPSSLRSSAEAKLKSKQRADWLIIAPRAMRTAAESLARLRQRERLTTFVADLEQVYDEFGGGNVTPHAIRDFIRSTRTWSLAPRYIVLAGNGTVDYRGIEVSPGVLPPLMTSTPDGIFAADSLFTDFNGDRLPDVAIGRIPVSSAAELSAYVAKLDANGRVNDDSAPIVFSADAADGPVNFRQASVEAEQPLSGRPASRVYVDDLGSGARSALLGAWQDGTPLVSWVGHGGLDLLGSSGILTAYDAPDLESSGPLPVLVAMTCTINRFENGYVDPLGVALTKADGAGAVAVWSASGLSEHARAHDIQRTFMRLAAGGDSRIGDLVVRSLAAHSGDTSSVYLLLGDPAIKLELPTEVRNDGPPSTSNE